MSRQPPHWGEFHARRQHEAEPPAADKASFADVCARLLTSADGQLFLRHLYTLHVDRRCPPGASEAILREAEAKRALVAEIERAVADGIERSRQKAN